MTRYRIACNQMLAATSAFVAAARELLAAAKDRPDDCAPELALHTVGLMRAMVQSLLQDAPHFASVFAPQSRE